jgi:hypothetical protein
MAVRLGFVETLGIVEVIGSAPDDHLVVRVKGSTEQRVIAPSQLKPIDCDAAKAARLQQLRSTHFRQGKAAGLKQLNMDPRRR